MSAIDFSIIVPFYNKEKTIESSIRGLLEQDYPRERYEVIFVNNNSADGSCSIIGKYPSVTLVREKTQGAYVARNAGILASRGTVLVFSDADAIAPKNWLSDIHAAMSSEDLDILIGWYLPAHAGRLLQIHSLLVCERIKIAVRTKQVSMITASASNLIIKRSVFDKEGLFMTVPRSEDKFFVLRCFERGYTIGFDEKIGVVRNDIDSLGTALRKNFTYGYANALYIDRALSPVKGVLWKFILTFFPVGLGLLLFSFSYYTGYCVGSLRRRAAFNKKGPGLNPGYKTNQ